MLEAREAVRLAPSLPIVRVQLAQAMGTLPHLRRAAYDEALAAVHRELAQPLVRGAFVESAFGHQDALRALDRLARGELVLGLVELGAQRGFLLEAGDRHLQDRLDAVALQPGDDVAVKIPAIGELRNPVVAEA